MAPAQAGVTINADIARNPILLQLAREGWGASILTCLKDITFDCLSLAVRFNPDPFLPLFPWPNAATFPAVRSER